MEGASTDCLRASAANWSLGGDEQLLHLLQNTHERIVSKCQDVNGKLDEMASALNSASIDLQNVNNKFMALSNTQFIESRVYDDDEVLVSQAPPTQVTPVAAVDEISMLKASLGVLARRHDTAEIMDDSDSDSDAEISVVLKPKDMYADRPLPYIIGSQQWKTKWHAGLIVEDSDTNSTTSERDREGQYSDTESEGLARPERDDNTLSESGSSLGGSLGVPASVPGAPPAAGAPLPAAETPARPADIAAVLARRLAVPDEPVIQEEAEDYPVPPAVPVARPLYKPAVPATSTIFSDEPPPLEVEDPHSSDDDIFAEINKHTPYTQKDPVRSNLTDDLFSFDKPLLEEGDIFSDFAPDKMEAKPVKQKSTLFEGDSEPEMFAEPPPRKDVTLNNNIARDEPSSKKPVGDISLFGSNKGTESIGAAILKRNQRKSSISDEDSGSDNLDKPIVQNKPEVITKHIENTVNKTMRITSEETDNTSATKKEKDIFEDLFSKPNNNTQQKSQNFLKESVNNSVVPDKSNVKEQKKTNVKDLFSDNIFDDIDDIFTSNVKIPSKVTDKSNQKSIFDDDDLFSDIDIAKSNKPSKATETNVKHNTIQEKTSIFDSDDDLFSDVKTDRHTESHKDKVTEKVSENRNEIVNKTDTSKEPIEISKQKNVVRLFDDSPQTKKVVPKPEIKNNSIFDSDSDSDDIFAKVHKPDKKLNKINDIRKPQPKNNNENVFNTNQENLLATDTAPKEKTLIQSPSLFEEDEIDDLFIAANKLKSQTDEKKNAEIADDTNYSEIVKIPSILNAIPELENPENENFSKETKEPKLAEVITAKTDTTNDDMENNLLQKNISSDNVEEIVEVIESSQDVERDPKKSFKVTSEMNRTKSHLEDSVTKHAKNASESLESQHILETQPGSVTQSTVTAKLKSSIPNADVFDDIFVEPPAFEKPAEPKKSKNVNALFDDDSDDESLFFKKNDVISDEKPEIFSNNVNFDIFVNEPPAIDVDFTAKPSCNSGVEYESFKNHSMIENLTITRIDDENFSSSETNETVKERVTQLSENGSDIENELFSTVTNVKDVPDLTNISNSDKEVSNAEEDLFADVPIIEIKVPAREIHEVNKVNTDDNKSKNKIESKRQISLFDDTNDKDLFTTATEKRLKKSTISKDVPFDSNSKKSEGSDSDEELFASLPSLPKVSDKDESTSLISNTVDKRLIENRRDILKPTESPNKDSDVKKIGKLNTKHFNINVNALVPGASPKKVPKENKEDQKSMEQPQIIPDEEDVTPKPVNKLENDVTDQAPVNTYSEKKVSFDEKSESGVLDNSVSKQRARIQVKRRPSSRRARHEAARRSAIDFGDDTDNSSSFDEPKPKTFSTVSSHLPNERAITKDNTVRDNKIDVSKSSKSVPDPKTDQPVLESNENVEKRKPVNISEHEQKHSEATNEQKPTTTKVVYILNDEDIFNIDSKTLDKDLFESKYVNKSKDLSTDEVDNLFKGVPGINTLGNTYKDTQNTAEINKTDELSTKISKESVESIGKGFKQSQKDKLSLFDDSDEELFSKKKEVKKKTTIFDSDSEEDLFSGKKNKEKNNKEQKNMEVKEKREVKEQKEVVKISLFSDDDDDDLFGLKKDYNTKTKQDPILSTSKEVSAATTASKPVKPVFSDPLSLLGDDD